MYGSACWGTVSDGYSPFGLDTTALPPPPLSLWTKSGPFSLHTSALLSFYGLQWRCGFGILTMVLDRWQLVGQGVKPTCLTKVACLSRVGAFVSPSAFIPVVLTRVG